jgi:hypothetical protein
MDMGPVECPVSCHARSHLDDSYREDGNVDQ